MWVCLNNGFFSVVDAASTRGCLLVRARRSGDIERVFGVKEVESPGRDYRYRAEIERAKVAGVMSNAVLGINYDNFKNSVGDDKLHDAYAGVWHVMGKLQPGGPYSRQPVGAESRKKTLA